MKIFHFILALYLAALSVYPCNEDDCLEKSGIVNDLDDHENGDFDLCTPFCISSCCSIHIYCAPQFDSLIVFQKVIAPNSTYTIKFAPVVVVSIWQPPKLA